MIKRVFGRFLRRFGAGMPEDFVAPKEYFTEIYDNRVWRGRFSKSGPGSEGEFAAEKIRILQNIVRDFEISSILDIGCGDFYWMKEVAPLLKRYHGVDVVESVIHANNERFGDERITFQCLDLTDRSQQQQLSYRRPDLVMCLDIFGHLLTKEVTGLLRFILQDMDPCRLWVSNRRDAHSADYLEREKTRNQGIDIEKHPLFRERCPRRLFQQQVLATSDFLDLYDLR